MQPLVRALRNDPCRPTAGTRRRPPSKILLDIVRDDDAGQAERVIETADQPKIDAEGNRIESDERLVVDQDFGSMTIARASATRRPIPRHSLAGIRSIAPRRPTACSLSVRIGDQAFPG